MHVCIEHPQIARMLKFRNHLRSHPEMRNEYQSLKLKLEEENTEGIGEYLEGKATLYRQSAFISRLAQWTKFSLAIGLPFRS